MRTEPNFHFQSGDSRESIPDRIVSINKPYVRPIVRGKEVKSVEFGAFPTMHKKLFGVDVKKIGGDTGYAATENRVLHPFSSSSVSIQPVIQLADRIEQRAQLTAA